MEPGEFEVINHYYIENRGSFVIGHIKSGIFQIGMKVPIDQDGSSLTISGIESVDYVGRKIFHNAIIFKEKPSLDYVKKVFPVGSVLRAYG